MSVLTVSAAPVETIVAPGVDFVALMPVLILLGAAVLSVVFEAVVPRALRYVGQVGLAVVAILGALVWTVLAGRDGQYALTLSGAIAIDQATYMMWGILLVLALISVLLMADRVAEPGGAFVAQAASRVGSARDRADTVTATPMQTEVFPLALFAISGMLVFPAAADMLTLFVALEVLSLPLYLMCGLARRRRLISQEAAVKYFLLGAFASAILLYGIALLYGYAGSLRFADIALASQAGGRNDLLLLIGMALLVVGLLFKGSVGPFHSWTPDVYQGAPTPVTAFMAACTKVAAFAAMLRIFMVAFEPTSWSWRGVMWGVAIASMLIGAIIGITQTDFKRMLAYSSVAHAGFLMLGVISLTEDGVSSTLFYLLTYGFATIGALSLLTLVRTPDGEATHLSAWAGLAKKSPMLAALMTIFLLSFAGIPLTAGFIGKLTIFTAATESGMAPLVVIAMVATAITAFFYLRIVVLMYFAAPAADGANGGKDNPVVTLPGSLTMIVSGICAAATVLLGLLPSAVIDLLTVNLPFLS